MCVSGKDESIFSKGALVGTTQKDEWVTLMSDGKWQRAGSPKNIPGLQDTHPEYLLSNAHLDLAELDLELLSWCVGEALRKF